MDMKTFNRQQRTRRVSVSGAEAPREIAEPAPEQTALASKLEVEIEQLENWLANQQKAQQGSVSVIPTIKSLIHTRKKLLKNIQTSNQLYKVNLASEQDKKRAA